MEIDHQTIEVHAIRTHFLIAGGEIDSSEARRTVILLHGGGIDCAELSWAPLIEELARDMRVIALDWPGYGESDHLRLAYSTEFYIGFLEAFLEKLGISRASFVGISMGGGVALGFGLKAPKRVDSLVLVDTYGLQDRVPYGRLGYYLVHMPGINEWSWALMRSRMMVRYTLGSLLKRPGAVTDALVDLAVREINRPNANLAWPTFQKNEVTLDGPRTCYLDQLDQISAPVLILHGTKDTLVPGDYARLAHEKIPGSKLHWMEGCGHWPQRDDPQTFNSAVRDFLNEI